MVSIPTQVILDLYYAAKNRPGHWFHGGRGYEMCMDRDGRFTLKHYSTVIFEFDPATHTYTAGGYSASDRDAINSMVSILGLGDKATNAGGDISFKRSGTKTSSYSPRAEEGYKAPRRFYIDARNDAYEGTLGPKGNYSMYKPQKAANEAQRDYDGMLDEIGRAEDAGEIIDGWIEVDISRGDQYKATLYYDYYDIDGRVRSAKYEGKRTGGWGYDKLSTAISEALNMSPEFKRLLYQARETGLDAKYGVTTNAGKADGPRFNWGVGIGSIMSSFSALGFKLREREYSNGRIVYTFSRTGALPSESRRSRAPAGRRPASRSVKAPVRKPAARKASAPRRR